ncbi:hypothetical protein LAL01_00120 [Companilactobacillus alimentarius]|nr:hypothetical protein LAL01_00120 [Companilactobacillus alimentarius]
MIEIDDLSKNYGEKKALQNLSLKIPEGQIFGFLGHNGAGKSTTLKSLVSILQPSSGSITVDGLDLIKNWRKSPDFSQGMDSHLFCCYQNICSGILIPHRW